MYQLYSYKCNKRRQAVKEKRLPPIESHLRQETINWSHDRLVEELAKSKEAEAAAERGEESTESRIENKLDKPVK